MRSWPRWWRRSRTSAAWTTPLETSACVDTALPRYQEELNAVPAEVHGPEAAIDRHLQAFESGTTHETVGGPRQER